MGGHIQRLGVCGERERESGGGGWDIKEERRQKVKQNEVRRTEDRNADLNRAQEKREDRNGQGKGQERRMETRQEEWGGEGRREERSGVV